MLLGATYLIMKTEGEAQQHAIRTAWIAGALMLIAAAGISLWTPIRYPFVAEKWFGNGIISAFVIPPLFAVVCSGMLARALWKRYEYAPFAWSIGIFLCSLSGEQVERLLTRRLRHPRIHKWRRSVERLLSKRDRNGCNSQAEGEVGSKSHDVSPN